jgi:quercetin dioxygenase-like cupin family protein
MDPLNTAANVYKQVMENDRVRVLQVVFKPGDIAKMHHHPDHVIYAIQGGKIKITSEGKTNEMELKPGGALFLTAQDHEAQNTGKTTINLLVVELKK